MSLGGRLPRERSHFQPYPDVRPRYTLAWPYPFPQSRYPIKFRTQSLDYTRRRGKNRAKDNPIRNVAIAGYALAEWRGHYDEERYRILPPPTREQIAIAARMDIAITANYAGKRHLLMSGAVGLHLHQPHSRRCLRRCGVSRMSLLFPVANGSSTAPA
jgi:hypothetical protein